MRDVRLTPDIADTAIDAGLAMLNGGTVTIYTDPRPNRASDPVGNALELVTFTLAATAFSAADGGSAKAATVSAATATAGAGKGQGHATWFRAYAADHSPLLDGRLDDDGSGDMKLSKYEIFTGDTVSLSDWTFVIRQS